MGCHLLKKLVAGASEEKNYMNLKMTNEFSMLAFSKSLRKKSAFPT